MSVSKFEWRDAAPRLAIMRRVHGWSQVELGVRSGLHPTAVAHYEHGRRAPSLANLCALADALYVSTDYLLGRKKEKA